VLPAELQSSLLGSIIAVFQLHLNLFDLLFDDMSLVSGIFE
jgi:hypothetical protein